MVRRVIEIDREKCNGCGACADACQEGAIGMVDGKAVLLRDDYCDGLGNCLPHCPANAITFVEREAAAFDEKAVAAAQLMKKAASLKGSAPVTRSGCSGSAALQMGCPGSQADTLHQGTDTAAPMRSAPASRLMQWPVQIKLLPVQAPFYQGARPHGGALLRRLAEGGGNGAPGKRKVFALAGGNTGPGRNHSGIMEVNRMKATVNENCIGCGLCAGTCPVVFTMGDDGLAHGGEIPANQQTEAETARDGCPVSAISIED